MKITDEGSNLCWGIAFILVARERRGMFEASVNEN